MPQDGVPILISAQDPSFWQSCLSLVPQLALSYDLAFGLRKKTIRVPVRATEKQLLPIARKIHDLAPSKIIFYDHRPHPEMLLRALRQTGSGRLPPLYFHIYGSFTLETPHWRRTEPLLKDTLTAFICASERQERLVGHFLRQPQNLLTQSAFAVDTALYHHQPALRRRARKHFGLSDDAYAVVYAGRLSEQKNIHGLIESFAKFAAHEPSCELFLAGLFDDVGLPMFRPLPVPGSYFFTIEKTLKALPPKIRKKIHFLGMLESKRLAELYAAGDLFASLSVHHDEDFGLSPAEALCTGTPALLSDWGGFSSYHKISPNDVALIPIHIRPSGLTIDPTEIANHFEFFFRGRKDPLARAARSVRYRAHFSPEATADRLLQIHSAPLKKFSGFQPLIERHAALWNQDPIFVAETSDVYREVYGAYVRENYV